MVQQDIICAETALMLDRRFDEASQVCVRFQMLRVQPHPL